MDEMDIDTVLEVPDTPERISVQRISGLKFGKDSNAFAGHARRTEFLRDDRVNHRRFTDKYALDNGHDRRGPSHPIRQPINVDEIEQRNGSAAFSSSGNCYTSASSPLFRRASCSSVNHEARHGIAAHAVDKGKSVKNKQRSNSPVNLGNKEIFDLTEVDEHRQMLGVVPSHVGSNKVRSGNVTGDVVSDSGSSRHLPPTSISSNAYKGKEKLDVFSSDAFCSAVDQGTKIGLGSGSHLPATSPRVTGQKRLVRNGCISPQNIASRAQKLAESIRASSTAAHKNHVANVSDGPSHPDIREIVAEDCTYNRAKGKGVAIRPPKPKEYGVPNIHVSTSSMNEVANQMGEVGKVEMSNGWRRTHNHVKKPNDSSLNVVGGCVLERDDGVRNSMFEQNENRMAKRDCERINTARVEPSLDKLSARSSGANKLSKRQRKHGLTSRNQGDCSMAPDDSEITFLGSSLEPSSSRSSRSRSFQPERNLYPIYEIDEPSHDMENNNSQSFDFMNNDDSEARARQLEADEILARELQEQFYNETPVFDEHQIDENVAWALQQVDDFLPAAYNQNYPVSRPRTSATVHSNRQPRARSFTTSSNRRGASARGPNNRAQLRSRIFNQPPTAVSRVRSRFPASRGRNFRFPLGMDLDMRLDILEALEAAVGDFSDMSMNSDHMLRVQRDFNENDYEMLLALDDNNHQRGASVNQISGLPESVVQTDNFEEVCAICLETPTRGETIRHLPCLHKFHKDCIDPWLRRKTSCPVCKSSVT